MTLSMLTFFEDIKAYVGFSEADTEALRSFLPSAEPDFPRISEHFYDRIQQHPSAHAAIRGGEEQVERLKRTLVVWMRSGLEGPHDEVFYERRAKIGRVHVQIGLPQQYMFTAMNVMRLDFRELVDGRYPQDEEARRRINAAVDRLYDLELAIMLQTYREDSEDRLRRKERLATLGQVAAGIGHDLRNPLGVIESSLYLIRRRVEADDRLRAHLDKIAYSVKASNRIITDLLEMVRDRPPRLEPLDVGALLEQAITDAAVPDNVQTHLEVEEGLALAADAGLLLQSLVNLVSNAVSALEGRPGHVWVAAIRQGPGDVALTVADDGPGFDTATLEIAFEPLVTTRAKGIGLGLALVRSIALRHGGRVEASNRPEGGALVRVLLPAGSTLEQDGTTSSQ